MTDRQPTEGGASSAWLALEEALTEVLAVLEDDQFLVVSVKRSLRFVQFASRGSFGLRAEVSSNAFLPPNEQVNAEQAADLELLGWVPPSGAPDEVRADGSPNFCRDFPAPVAFAEVARLAVRTLAEVLAVPHPSGLEYEAFDADGQRILLPTLGLAARPVMPAPAEPTEDDVESARTLVLGVMREATGAEDVAFDEDGDIAVRFGSAAVFVRVVEEPLFVRVYSPVLANLEVDGELLRRVNEINADLRFARLVVIDTTVIAAIDLFAFPLVADHVAHACVVLGNVADQVDNLLQAEFGGRTAFGEFRSRPRRRDTAGYL